MPTYVARTTRATLDGSAQLLETATQMKILAAQEEESPTPLLHAATQVLRSSAQVLELKTL